MRVLHVIDNLALGGSQQLLVKSVAGLHRRGIQCSICVLGTPAKTHPGFELPVTPTYLQFAGDYRWPFSLLPGVRKLADEMARVAPDIVHSYLWRSDLLVALANRRRGCRHLSYIVDRRNWLQSRRVKHRFRKWVTRRALRRSGTTFVAVSNAARDFALKNLSIVPDRVQVVYNSVDVHEFETAPPPCITEGTDRLVLGMASRLEPEKGHLDLLEAIRMLRDRGRPVQLLVTGDGPYKSQLVERARQLEISTAVRFVGWVESMHSFLDAIDVFTVPSVDSEGLPTTILEAMAARRVVVATDVGGATEAIRNEVDGLIVPPRRPRMLADAVESLIGDQNRFSRLAESARDRVVREFSTEQMVDSLADCYHDLCPASNPYRQDALVS